MKRLISLSIIYGIIYAFCFTDNNTGIACPIFGIIFTLSMFYIIKRSEKQITLHSVVYGVCSILLSFIPAVSDNEYIFYGSRLLIIILGIKWALEVYYKPGNVGILRNIYSVIEFGLKMVFEIPSPVKDYSEYKKEHESVYDRKKAGQVIKGILISMPFLIIILWLLSDADVVFGSIISGIFISPHSAVIFIKAIYSFVVGFLIIYCGYKALAHDSVSFNEILIKQSDVITGITFTAIVSAVYLLFCGIQILVLFTSQENLLPEGYTYAQYARTGFFQLLFVCVINLILVIVCILKFEEHKILKGILYLISGCTFIMIASSAYRMIMYVQNYSLSFLRILVLWFLVVLTVVMAFAVLYIHSRKFDFLNNTMIAFTIMFLIFSFMMPDKIICRYNISHFDNQKDLDIHYLMNELSLDATSILLISNEIGDTVNTENMYSYCENVMFQYEVNDKKDIRKFNISRYMAYQSAKKYIYANSV
ncbi:MAG: DUF4173 domain-containing protein [Lachnospiraceae bacterium]|nr:DUF4173 domain-containing protein [Lachnospiraceae bacterium]